MSNAIGMDYGWRDAQAPHSCAYIVPELLALLRRHGARRVLDLGCGNGATCAAIAHAGFEIVGVEPDAQGVALARAAHPTLRFHALGVQDDPRRLLDEEAPFDTVISTEVIEHLYSPHQLVQFAHAVLPPGGTLILSTPYHGYLKNLALSVSGQWDHHFTPLWHGGHIKFWSRRTLGQLLLAHGFEPMAFRGVGRAPWLWKSMLIAARRQP